MTIAETLRREIRNNGKSCGTLAKETGIARSILVRFLIGGRDIKLETADKLIAYFDLELKKKTNKAVRVEVWDDVKDASGY